MRMRVVSEIFLSVTYVTTSPLHHCTISPLLNFSVLPFKAHLLPSAPAYRIHCPDKLRVPTTVHSMFSTPLQWI